MDIAQANLVEGDVSQAWLLALVIRLDQSLSIGKASNCSKTNVYLAKEFAKYVCDLFG